MISRRGFIGTLACGLFAAPLAAEAQQGTKVPRVGYLLTASLGSPESRVLLDAFRQGLRERGYVEGQNIVIEYRSADNKIERFPGLATELARLNVDLIVAGNTAAARAALKATNAIPIVSFAMGDPVGDGLVASLARPGGNVTGSTFLGPGLVAKRLQLLKEAIPRISRVAALWHPAFFNERTNQEMLKEIEAAALTLGVKVQFVGVADPGEFDHAFSAIARGRADALFVFPGGMLYSERGRIVTLATKHRLPSIYGAKEYVELGGLISYGASINDLARRGAGFVDKILKGAKPGDLPIEQPTTFELVINLKTAKALGLTIPPSLLGRADEIIE
jgi:putative ABC transport system substrate-binding protein